MFNIEWQPNGKEKWLYNHNKFVFKKELFANVFLYKIYQSGEIIYNTTIERDFMMRARYVYIRNAFPEGNNLKP